MKTAAKHFISGRAARLAVALLAVMVFAGCAGYRLGPANGMTAAEKSLQVMPFANQTLQPRLTDPVTAQLRKEIQRDGTFRLATHGDGDIILSGTILKYERNEITFAVTDILTVRDFKVILTAHVLARERATGKLLLDQTVTGTTLLRVGNDITNAERQAAPLLAAELARNIVSLLAEGKW